MVARAEFTEMDLLSRDCTWCCAQGVIKGSKSFSGWWAGWHMDQKRWSTLNNLEMPSLSWFNVGEGIQSLKETGMLRPTHPGWKGPEDMPFTRALRNTFVRRAPEPLQSSCSPLLCRVDLNTVWMNGSRGGRGHVVVLSCQRTSDVVTVTDRDT